MSHVLSTFSTFLLLSRFTILTFIIIIWTFCTWVQIHRNFGFRLNNASNMFGGRASGRTYTECIQCSRRVVITAPMYYPKYTLGKSSIFERSFVKRFAACYRTVVCLSCSVCNVGVLWPNGWMDHNATWQQGRPHSRPHCVRWGASSPYGNGHRGATVRSMSIVAKRLDGSGYHLARR